MGFDSERLRRTDWRVGDGGYLIFLVIPGPSGVYIRCEGMNPWCDFQLTSVTSWLLAVLRFTISFISTWGGFSI